MKMEGLKLGEIEKAYYAELFQTCDVEGTGKIPSLKASELFLASSLPQDALKQIWELCGAKRLGHFGRSQFYIALKLIAVAQNSLPLKLDTLNAGIEIPLPKFSSKSSDPGDRKRVSAEGDLGDGKGQTSGAIPPPPATKQSHRRSLSGQYRGVVPDGTVFPNMPQVGESSPSTNRDDSPHNSKSPGFSPKESPPTSPIHGPRMIRQQTAPASYGKDVIHDTGHVNPVALASNNIGEGGGGGGPGGGGGIVNPAMSTATGVGNGPSAGPGTAQHNSSNENGNWAMFEDDENHSELLIGNGVKKWEQSIEPAGGGVDSSSISSEAESVDDVWTITEEQREYYVKQFLTMQPDLAKHITGPVAKNFFEKSKLPVVELSKIWQLSDLNRDGALSVEEFCIAMHLVVLRRNEIELPDILPVSLMPYSTLSDEPFAADLPPGSTLKRVTPPSPVENKQWKASFIPESPGSSGVSSPAHLVNFDYAQPSADPVSIQDSKIIHPVAVRASPDNNPIPPAAAEGFDRDSAVPSQHDSGDELGGGGGGGHTPRARTESHPPPSHAPPPPSDLSTCDSPGPGSKYNANIQGRPRPIPKKPTAVPVVSRGQLQPPPPSSQQEEEGGAAPGVAGSGDPAAASVPPSQEPPTPPPRPQMHGRSMSVDMKAGSSMLPPAVPPRVQPKDTQFSQKASESGATAESKGLPKRLVRASILKHRRSASLGFLKVSAISLLEPALEGSVGGSAAGPPGESQEVTLGSGEDIPDSVSKDSFSQPMAQRQMSRDKRDIGMAIRTHKERNAMLTRLNSELNQELQEVMEQRIALEIQLEHLKPFSS
ncbi:ralBP1-associated Eps domain-containing protein 1-like isoform X6 [Littorina saxatilis]|uniref:ralBP1-associated Eps domain-containing protein 1-like isoform X6 n=1 Tax=Littorina saxatilis TaxID=31220 RepID=UPI0038B45785